jgi:hypothetical protein
MPHHSWMVVLATETTSGLSEWRDVTGHLAAVAQKERAVPKKRVIGAFIAWPHFSRERLGRFFLLMKDREWRQSASR